MSYKAFVIPALLGIGIAGFFMVRSLNHSVVYYLRPSEAVAQRAAFPDGRVFRLAGIVEAGTMHQEAGVYTFDVTDGAATVKVRLVKTPPPLFKENVQTVLEGSWQGDTFVSDLALVRHDENYQAPPVDTAPTPGG